MLKMGNVFIAFCYRFALKRQHDSWTPTFCLYDVIRALGSWGVSWTRGSGEARTDSQNCLGMIQLRRSARVNPEELLIISKIRIRRYVMWLSGAVSTTYVFPKPITFMTSNLHFCLSHCFSANRIYTIISMNFL